MTYELSSAAASAANRFGLGAAPASRQSGDPKAWLLAQTQSPPTGSEAFTGLPTSLDYLRREAAFVMERRNLKQDAKDAGAGAGADSQPVDPLRRLYIQAFGDDLRAEFLARWQLAADTPTPFSERLTRFWSNHFAVSTDKNPARLYAAPMEREAIRPHVNGRFLDMLMAVETHPAMLRYLDQPQSIGPDSRAAGFLSRRLAERATGMPAREFGLNENLAREILELHTLGADSGYTQADVTEFARALTGWSMPGPGQIERGMSFDSAFLYREPAHQPGLRTILGKRYPDQGQDQARAVLTDLALHPATANHLATKLARHFVADQPPLALVRKMSKAYLDSDGELPAMYVALIESPEAWSPQARKFRTPQDLLIAAIRGGSVAIGERPQVWEGGLVRLGQPTFQPRSPAGYTDIASDWISPDAIWKRVQIAQAIGQHVPRASSDPDPLARAQAVLGPHLDRETRQALTRAEAPEQAMALLFAAPAFQWRT